MNQPLTCPACQRTKITTSTCPNCETDLAALQILANLPLAKTGLDYRWLGLAVLMAIGGFVAAKISL
jgi:primosomal protein N'